MKLKCILVVLCMGITFSNTRAQNSPLSLKPGQPVPDITFNIMNNEKGSISLSGLRGKLVILDFWSTGCIACIKKFPLLDSLQTMFGDKIKIILVNPKRYKDDEHKVNRIFEIYKKNHGKTLGLSSTIYDTTAVKYFPHTAQSHFAWIDQQGVVKAISGYVKKEDIEAILAGKKPDITPKDDFIVIEENEQLLTNPVSKIRFKSMITGYLDVSRDFKRDHYNVFGSTKQGGIRFINEPLFRILFHAHSHFTKQNKIIFEGLNRSDFICPEDVPHEIWSVKNAVCYELIAPNMTNQEAMEQCKKDIAAHFKVRAAIEQRKVPCWVIKMDERQMKRVQQKNKKLNKLPHTLSSFAEYYFPDLELPVVVETKFDEKLFPEFGAEYKFRNLDASDIQQFAKANGLSLTREDRELTVFVIRKVE